jgi:hypothetical protein
MKPATVLLNAILVTGAAALATAAVGSEPAETESADAKTVEAKTAESKPAEKEFVPPPGFAKKKRGKYILYCKKDVPMGTRIKTETCYDEAQMRNYMLALQETKGDVDRIRAICSNPCACGQPEAC